MKSKIFGLYTAWLIAAVMLVFAVVGRHPYSYYTLLRWVCCTVFVYSAVTSFQLKRVLWAWIFGVQAVLFNPLIQFHFRRDTWQTLDVVSVGCIVIAAVLIAVFVLVTALLSPLVCLAQSPETDPAKLNQQIEQLRRENQLLRSLLTQPQAPAANPAQPTSATAQATSTVAPAGQQQELTHWLTLSSNKRHNSSCRWFKTSKGRPCRADEGIPCKICGG
jgi:Tfp pilus assembly protein PilV